MYSLFHSAASNISNAVSEQPYNESISPVNQSLAPRIISYAETVFTNITNFFPHFLRNVLVIGLCDFQMKETQRYRVKSDTAYILLYRIVVVSEKWRFSSIRHAKDREIFFLTFSLAVLYACEESGFDGLRS